MRHYLTYILVFAAAALLSFGRAEAQNLIEVSGTVVKLSDGAPLSEVEILTFDNIIRAKDEYNNMLKNLDDPDIRSSQPSITQYTYAEPDGSYRVSVADNGAIIYVNYYLKPVLEIVKGRKRINVKINDASQLDIITIEGDHIVRKDPVIEEEMVVGNQYSKKMVYYFDKDKLGEIEGIGYGYS